MQSVDRRPAINVEVQDGITGAGAEQAVIRFFDGRLSPGKHRVGNKYIEVKRDHKGEILHATARVDRVVRAVINSYYGKVYAAYFMLLGEKDANGNRDELIFNRGIFGGGDVMLFSGPGVNLCQKELVSGSIQRQDIARRLGVELNVPPQDRIPVIK